MFTLAYAQTGRVGVNTDTPAATFDVAGKPADAAVVDGVIAPRLTGDQLQAKDAVYTAAQTGTLVYATAATAAPAGKTVNVTAAGYYYFDGTVWQAVTTGSTKLDLRLVNTTSHITIDAGVGSNGTSAGAADVIAIGAGAGNANASKNNVFIGTNAGNANTSGYGNTFMGSQAAIIPVVLAFAA